MSDIDREMTSASTKTAQGSLEARPPAKIVGAAAQGGTVASPTGPLPPSGRLRYRYKGVKTSLYAKNLLATAEHLSEDDEKFREILRELQEHYQPRDPVTALMVEDFACLTWRIGRILRTEGELVADRSTEIEGTRKVRVVDVYFGDEKIRPWFLKEPAEEEKEQVPTQDETAALAPASPETVTLLPWPTRHLRELGQHEDRLRRHWFHLYRELERQRSLRMGEPVPPQLLVDVD